MEHLYELTSVYQDIGPVIIMGDFNVKINGPRLKVNDDKRTLVCKSFMSKHNLFSANLDSICDGSIFTFQSYAGGPASCIDHILLKNSYRDDIIKCEILDDHTFALSDHHPVVCALRTQSHFSPQAVLKSEPTVSWDKARLSSKIDDYTFAVSQNLWTLDFPKSLDFQSIELYYQSIIAAIKSAETATLPYNCFKKHVKPYWSEELTILRDSMRQQHNVWKDNCGCHDAKCDLFKYYKDAKRHFRSGLRKSFDDYQSSLVQKIETEIDINQKSVWSIINRRKSKQSVCSALKKNGITYTDPHDISELWYEHFENVFKHSTFEDPERGENIFDKVSVIRNTAKLSQNLDDLTIKLHDAVRICSHLKNDKASGHDRISYEHIMYGGLLKK